MSIEKRLERIEAILDARGLDWDHPMVASDHFADANKMVAEEPPKKWRILEPGEVVCSGDMVNAKSNLPHGLGWKLQTFSTGQTVSKHDECVFARPVAEPPAKEASLDGLPDIRTFAQPNLRWRILRPDEIVQDGDWMNARVNSQEVGPPDGGWLAAPSFYFGKEASVSFGLYFARPVTEKPRLGSGEAYRLLSKEQLEDFIPFGDFGMGTGLCGTSSIDEPAKEAEHPAGPMPDPGEGYRLLSKDPLEDLQPGDDYDVAGVWVTSEHARTHKIQHENTWYRRKIEQPKPAWEPKVGDWVLVTRPENWKEWKDPLWREEMHIYDGRVFELVKWSQSSTGRRASLQGIDWFFHRDWLSPAKPPKDEYREPVLPADAGKYCQFSDDGIEWRTGWLNGWVQRSHQWISHSGGHWRHARIKKDA